MSTRDTFVPLPRDPHQLEQLGITERQPVIGAFSSLRPDKRLGDLIAAAPHILNAHPDTVFVLAGGGSERQRLRRVVAMRGLGASFRLPGEIDHEAMPSWLALADVVVLASEREGCPLAVLEAQACGRTLVASDTAALREVVVDGRTGVLFRVGDPESLARSAVALLADPRQRATIGAEARRAREDAAPEEWADSYADLLATVVRGRPTQVGGRG